MWQTRFIPGQIIRFQPVQPGGILWRLWVFTVCGWVNDNETSMETRKSLCSMLWGCEALTRRQSPQMKNLEVQWLPGKFDNPQRSQYVHFPSVFLVLFSFPSISCQFCQVRLHVLGSPWFMARVWKAACLVTSVSWEGASFFFFFVWNNYPQAFWGFEKKKKTGRLCSEMILRWSKQWSRKGNIWLSATMELV